MAFMLKAVFMATTGGGPAEAGTHFAAIITAAAAVVAALGTCAAAVATVWAVRTALKQSEEARQENRRMRAQAAIWGVCDRLISNPTTSLKDQRTRAREVENTDALEEAWVVLNQINRHLADPALRLVAVCRVLRDLGPTATGIPKRDAAPYAEQAVRNYRAWLLAGEGSRQAQPYDSLEIEVLETVARVCVDMEQRVIDEMKGRTAVSDALAQLPTPLC